MGLPDLATLRSLHVGYARLALMNEEAMPIFMRIDADLRDAEALAANDPVMILRALMAKRRAAA